MPEKTWLDYVTALGAVLTPIMVLVLTGVGHRIRQRLERRIDLEDKLREERISAYNQILEPFIVLLITDTAWKADPANAGKDKEAIATQKLLSKGYREQAFKMSLVGSDAVVRSYNDLMQFLYRNGDAKVSAAGPPDPKQMIVLLGNFLLEIRKSMGNESTTLDNLEMLEWMITDARKLRG